jgi:uncharacterized protein YabE (DUF348 family)
VSKHHAVEDEPQSSDMSWILGLARPAENPSARSTQATPYYGSLVARAPRHAASGDDAQAADVPAAARTGALARISAEQIDTLIGRLDEVDPGRRPDDALVTQTDPAVEGAAAEPSEPSDPSESSVQQADDPTPPFDEPVRAETQVESGADAGSTAAELVADADGGPDADVVPDAEVVAPPISTPSTRRTSTGRGLIRKPILLGAAAALCLLTVGGGTMTAANDGAAVAAPSKTVTIVVDGQAEKISTVADSVSGALAAAGITPAGHDSLAPGGQAPISNGSTIVLNRGRQLTLTIDGQQRQIWTTARTVDEALAQWGPPTSDWLRSANRSRAIPLTGLAVSGATLHTVAMSVAGTAAQSFTTPAKTVGDLLALQKITLGPLDRVSPPAGTKLSDGLVVTVDRVVISSATATVALRQPAAKTVTDATIVRGSSKVAQQGKAGSQLITYQVTSVNGKQTAKKEQSRRTVVQPVGTITHIGTKSSFTYVGSEVFTNDTSFGVNWDGLAMCESTHNPQAINADPVAGLPTYGMFQFDLPTWASVGGSGNPIDASPEEQLMRAKLLFQQRGLEPWACRDAAH